MRIFKALTLVVLIGVFYVLISQREVMFTPQARTSFKASPLVVKSTSTSEQQLTQNESTSTQNNLALSTTSNTLANTSTITEVSQPIKKVDDMPQKNVYVAMKEGRSDTDESYVPTVSPCVKTMGYRMGTFDSHFGIKESVFKDEIDKAQALWGNRIGRTLFSYDAHGPLTINLIYDERQARTDDINNLALEIQNSKDTAESLKGTYEAEKTIYLGDGEQLTKDSDAFKARYDVYMSKVTMYNSQGGAPQDEYNRMAQELASLKEESKQLATRRDNLLTYMEKINAKVNRYNELVVYINSLITKSNSLGAKKFTEGKFTPYTNTIDIYQYTDAVKLHRVLAHELGHVLGINHNDNIRSIMYAVNSATATELSPEDTDSLFNVCPLD